MKQTEARQSEERNDVKDHVEVCIIRRKNLSHKPSFPIVNLTLRRILPLF